MRSPAARSKAAARCIPTGSHAPGLPEFLDLLDWQWNEIVTPYRGDEARFAASLWIGVAIEMHPGFVVYNRTTPLQLRARAGETSA